MVMMIIIILTKYALNKKNSNAGNKINFLFQNITDYFVALDRFYAIMITVPLFWFYLIDRIIYHLLRL